MKKTDEELEALRDRTTPFPWFWQDYGSGGRTLAHQFDPMFHELNILKTTDDWPPRAEDEELIRIAPELLAEVLELRQTLKVYKENYTRMCGEIFHLEVEIDELTRKKLLRGEG